MKNLNDWREIYDTEKYSTSSDEYKVVVSLREMLDAVLFQKNDDNDLTDDEFFTAMEKADGIFDMIWRGVEVDDAIKMALL